MQLSLSSSSENLASPEKETIRRFFEGIASRYDLINNVLSFRLDETWRKKAVRMILKGRDQYEKILDLGVGTGKFLKEFTEARSWQLAAGADFAGEMLTFARQNLPPSCFLLQTDIHDLPFSEQSFDLIVSSFTLRSVKNIPHFFSEVHRVLRSGGRAAFLCLTRPTNFFARMVYMPYLKIYLPLAGGLLSQEPKAYRFLSESIQTFISPAEIKIKLESSGFDRVSVSPFTLGISTLISAEK